MKRLAKLLLLAVLTCAALTASARKASALNWCLACQEGGGCIDCCLCENETLAYCLKVCG
jgi:hypothetical protein